MRVGSLGWCEVYRTLGTRSEIPFSFLPSKIEEKKEGRDKQIKS